MIVLKNCTFIDWKSLEFKVCHIKVEEGSESQLIFLDSLDNISKETILIDCTGKYVTKSFGCAHHHAYSALTTGMPNPIKTPENYYEILSSYWWKLDKALDLELIKYSAYVTAIACAKNGVTFVIDHHSSPMSVEGSLQTIADAFNEVGVGHLLSYEISDRNGVNAAKMALSESEAYLANNQGLVGLQASFTLTNKTLENAVSLAKRFNSGIHVHVAEDLYDQEHCYDIHNKRVIERFQDFGILDLPKSLLINCLYLTKAERTIIHDSGIHVVQNTESNLNSSIGEFNSCSISKNVLLGTDGLHSDMLRAAKAAYLNCQLSDNLDCDEIYHRFRRIHHYLNFNQFWGDEENNLVVLDYQPHTEFSGENFIKHFIYGIESSNIQHVISKGRLIVKDRQIMTVNETDIKERARQLSKKLWGNMETVG